MLGILCVDADLPSVAVDYLSTKTNACMCPIMVMAEPAITPRRFIYLANELNRAIEQASQRLVIIRTTWVKELAAAPEDWTGAARAIDRILLRFGAVSITQAETLQMAALKMASVQSPRPDIITFTGRESLDEAITQLVNIRRTRGLLPFSFDATTRNLSGSLSTAKAILVGDRINPYLPFEHWPFFDDRNAALYMSQALEKAGIPETMLAWTNANHPTGLGLILAMASARPSARLIALGEAASKSLDRLGLQHTRISHPAHARRFESQANYDLILDRVIRG